MTAPAVARKSPPVPYARPGVLPYRRPVWAVEFAVCCGVSAGVGIGGPLAGVDSKSSMLLAVAMGAVSAGLGAAEYRRHLRGLEVDRAAEQLAMCMGLPPSRSLLKATQWRGWPGRPGRLVVRYPSAGLLLDEDRVDQLTEVLSGQPWGGYVLDKIDERHRRMVFRPAPCEEPEDEEKAEQIRRAKRYVLAALGPTAHVVATELNDDGSLKAIEATHEIGHKLAPSGYRARLERVVSAVLPGRWRAQWELEKDWVRFELRPELKDMISPRIPDHSAPTPYSKVEIPFADDEDGNVMVWRPEIDPHMLLIGGTGTGKTSTVHNIVTAVAAMEWMVWVVDGKGIEFLGFRDWPNVQIVGSRLEHQIAIIHRAKEEMERRYQLIEEGASESDFEPILLVLDEFADFKGNLLDWYSAIRVGKAGDPTQPQVLRDVASLARKGRSARIHLLFATQRPDADFFGGRGMGDMRDNFRMRTSMGPLSPQGAMMLWENPSVGTTIPRGLRGRATTVNDQNVPVEVQSHYTPDPRKVVPGTEDYELIEKLRPPKVKHKRLVILDPDPWEREEAEDNGQPFSVFRWWMTAPWGWAEDHPEADPVRRRNRGGTVPVAALVGLQEFLTPGVAAAVEMAEESPDPGADPGGEGHDHRPEQRRPDSPRRTGRPNRGVASLAAAAGLSLSPPVDEHADSVGPHPGDEPAAHAVPDGGWQAWDRPPLPSPLLTLIRGGGGNDDPETESGDFSGEDDWPGYGPVQSVPIADVATGDLLCVDEDDGSWAVVFDDPAEDELDEEGAGLWSLTYCDIGNAEGLLSAPPDAEVQIRRPLDL